MATFVIKRNQRQSSGKILNKKSAKQILPKYLVYANFEV